MRFAASSSTHAGNIFGLEPWQRVERDLAAGSFTKDAVEDNRMHMWVEAKVTRCPLHDEHRAALPTMPSSPASRRR